MMNLSESAAVVEEWSLHEFGPHIAHTTAKDYNFFEPELPQIDTYNNDLTVPDNQSKTHYTQLEL